MFYRFIIKKFNRSSIAAYLFFVTDTLEKVLQVVIDIVK